MKTPQRLPLLPAILLVTLLMVMTASAQLLYPEVIIDLSKMGDEAKQKLAGLDSALTRYLESQDWARDEYRYDFPIQLNIFINEYTPSANEDKFKASLRATNKGEIRFDDNRWEFGLRFPVTFRPQEFDAFRSVVDFWVWMLIGTEYDKLEKLGGDIWYEKARQVLIQGTASAISGYGWDRREAFFREQVDPSNKLARELRFFYYTGAYYDEKKDYKAAKDYLHYALVKLEKVPIDVQDKFLEANHRQFAAALVRAGYPNGVKVLIQLDPKHRDVYESIAPEGKGK